MNPPAILPTTRPPLARMQHIHAQLASGRKVTCVTLAAELETSTRTIQRDVDYLRDSLRLPIEYDAPAHSYRYSQPPGPVLLVGSPALTPEVVPPGRHHGAAVAFHLPLKREPQGHLETICQRHSVHPEHVLAAIVGEALADAVCNSRLMDTIVRAARQLATNGEEVPA